MTWSNVGWFGTYYNKATFSEHTDGIDLTTQMSMTISIWLFGNHCDCAIGIDIFNDGHTNCNGCDGHTK